VVFHHRALPGVNYIQGFQPCKNGYFKKQSKVLLDRSDKCFISLKILSEDFWGGFLLRNSCLTSVARSLNFEEIEDLEFNKTFISRDFLVLFHLGKSTMILMAGKESNDMFVFHGN
jgi:hypothetical protein